MKLRTLLSVDLRKKEKTAQNVIIPLTTLLRLPGGDDPGGDGQPRHGHRGDSLPPFQFQDGGGGGGKRLFYKIELYIMHMTFIFFLFQENLLIFDCAVLFFFYEFIFPTKARPPCTVHSRTC